MQWPMSSPGRQENGLELLTLGTLLVGLLLHNLVIDINVYLRDIDVLGTGPKTSGSTLAITAGRSFTRAAPGGAVGSRSCGP